MYTWLGGEEFMSIFEFLFGKKNPEHKIFEKFKKIMYDEEYQLNMLDLEFKKLIQNRPVYDKRPDGYGGFGLCITNPIPVNGPIGEIMYLSSIETNYGEKILFHRLCAVGEIDVYEAVTFSGSNWFLLYLDFYHPKKSKLPPEGFRFSDEVRLVTGFNILCENFPYDFIETKEKDGDGLRLIRLQNSRIQKQLEDKIFNRPDSHSKKLEKLARDIQDIKNGKKPTTIVEFDKDDALVININLGKYMFKTLSPIERQLANMVWNIEDSNWGSKDLDAFGLEFGIWCYWFNTDSEDLKSKMEYSFDMRGVYNIPEIDNDKRVFFEMILGKNSEAQKYFMRKYKLQI